MKNNNRIFSLFFLLLLCTITTISADKTQTSVNPSVLNTADDDEKLSYYEVPVTTLNLPDFAFIMMVNRTTLVRTDPLNKFEMKLTDLTKDHLLKYFRNPSNNIMKEEYAIIKSLDLQHAVLQRRSAVSENYAATASHHQREGSYGNNLYHHDYASSNVARDGNNNNNNDNEKRYHTQDPVSKKNMILIEATFTNGRVDVLGNRTVDDLDVATLTFDALRSDYYWELIQDFSKDAILSSIQSLEISFFLETYDWDALDPTLHHDNDIANNNMDMNDNNNNNSNGTPMVVVLIVCITILCMSMALLLFMAYRQYGRTFCFLGDVLCCGRSTGTAKSDLTYEDEEEEDRDRDNHDDDGRSILGCPPPPPHMFIRHATDVVSARRKMKHRHRHHRVSSASLTGGKNSLDVITEEEFVIDESALSTVPLGVQREDMTDIIFPSPGSPSQQKKNKVEEDFFSIPTTYPTSPEYPAKTTFLI